MAMTFCKWKNKKDKQNVGVYKKTITFVPNNDLFISMRDFGFTYYSYFYFYFSTK